MLVYDVTSTQQESVMLEFLKLLFIPWYVVGELRAQLKDAKETSSITVGLLRKNYDRSIEEISVRSYSKSKENESKVAKAQEDVRTLQSRLDGERLSHSEQIRVSLKAHEEMRLEIERLKSVADGLRDELSLQGDRNDAARARAAIRMKDESEARDAMFVPLFKRMMEVAINTSDDKKSAKIEIAIDEDLMARLVGFTEAEHVATIVGLMVAKQFAEAVVAKQEM